MPKHAFFGDQHLFRQIWIGRIGGNILIVRQIGIEHRLRNRTSALDTPNIVTLRRRYTRAIIIKRIIIGSISHESAIGLCSQRVHKIKQRGGLPGSGLIGIREELACKLRHIAFGGDAVETGCVASLKVARAKAVGKELLPAVIVVHIKYVMRCLEGLRGEAPHIIVDAPIGLLLRIKRVHRIIIDNDINHPVTRKVYRASPVRRVNAISGHLSRRLMTSLTNWAIVIKLKPEPIRWMGSSTKSVKVIYPRSIEIGLVQTAKLRNAICHWAVGIYRLVVFFTWEAAIGSVENRLYAGS